MADRDVSSTQELPDPKACPVCVLVEVLEYARVELGRLEGASRVYQVDERHRPQRSVLERLQKALDMYRGHTHHYKVNLRTKAGKLKEGT